MAFAVSHGLIGSALGHGSSAALVVLQPVDAGMLVTLRAALGSSSTAETLVEDDLGNVWVRCLEDVRYYTDDGTGQRRAAWWSEIEVPLQPGDEISVFARTGGDEETIAVDAIGWTINPNHRDIAERFNRFAAHNLWRASGKLGLIDEMLAGGFDAVADGDVIQARGSSISAGSAIGEVIIVIPPEPVIDTSVAIAPPVRSDDQELVAMIAGVFGLAAALTVRRTMRKPFVGAVYRQVHVKPPENRYDS